MIRASINLSKRHRLRLRVVRRRGESEKKSILPSLEQIQKSRKGSKVSRYFRHVFEHKNIKKLLGVNLAFAVMATSFVPATSALTDVGLDQESIVIENDPILTTQRSIQYPVENVRITQGYKFYHPGIDLDGITGDPVKPIMPGVIEVVSYSQYAYGNAVLVKHENNLTTLYAHLSKILVEKGDRVNLDTIIGELGATGRAFGDHLHLEIRDSRGVPINPNTILPAPLR